MRKLAFLTAILCATSAQADLLTTGVSGPSTAAQAYTGPGDVASWTVWGGGQAYSRAECTGLIAAMRLRRTSGGESDINITTSCNLDIAAASTFCTAGADPCFVTTVYNRGTAGATHNYVQVTAGNQPAFIFNCLGTRPCMRAAAATVSIQSANSLTPATGVLSLFTVSRRFVAGGGSCSFVRANGTNNRLITVAAANTWQMITPTGGGNINRTATDTAWHAGVAVWNGASSYFLIDGGAPTTGTVNGNVVAGVPGGVIGSATATCDQVVMGELDNSALSAAVSQTLITTSRGYWGF